MRAGSGDHIYDWVENWPDAPDSESARNGWSHHGIVVSETGDIYTGHQDDPIVQVFGGDGRFKRVWPSGCSDTHSLTLVIEGCTEYLWIADNGAKRRPSTAFEYPDPDAKVTGQAIKKTLDGEDVMKLDIPLWTPIGRATTSPRGSRSTRRGMAATATSGSPMATAPARSTATRRTANTSAASRARKGKLGPSTALMPS